MAGQGPSLEPGAPQSEENTSPTIVKIFHIEYAASARAKCIRCKQYISQNVPRFYKLDNLPRKATIIKRYYHVDCLFQSFKRARLLQNVINDQQEVGGLEDMPADVQERIIKLIDENKRSDLISKPQQRKKPVVTHNRKNAWA